MTAVDPGGWNAGFEPPWIGGDDWSEESVSDDALPEVDDDPHSWAPVDISAVLEGRAERPTPAVGQRMDGERILYPGKVHSIAGESESGKTWFAVAIICSELEHGNRAVVIDFEDTELGWVGRLMDAGASVDDLRERFAYIKPEEPLGLTGRADLRDVLAGQTLGGVEQLPPVTVVILDGVTEAMTLHGLDPLKNSEVAAFGKRLPRWIARQGPAVLATDHLTKNAEGRGRYAIGAVHKLNGLDGAAFTLENRKPFGIGRRGESSVYLQKDRPGMLRKAARPSKGGDWFGDVVVESFQDQPMEVMITPPPAALEHGPPSGISRPTDCMRAVHDAVANAPAPLSRQEILDRVQGYRSDRKRLSIDLLIEDGYLRVEPATRGRKNHLVARPFTEGQ